MEPYVVIGGGLTGLLAGKSLKNKGLDFIGFEQGETLGGRVEVGHHRFYHEESTKLLEKAVGDLNFGWERISLPAQERKKGEWCKLGDYEFLEEEKFYFPEGFYVPSQDNLSKVVDSLVSEVGGFFETRSQILRLDLEKNHLELEDERIVSFSKVIWCAGAAELSHCWREMPGNIFGKQKKSASVTSPKGGLNLDMELSSPLLEPNQTVLFAFRFKDKRLRAIGVGDSPTESNTQNIHWLLFLDDETAEDREEVAKCVRALKRELRKEFPEMESTVTKERIAYLSVLSGEPPVEVNSLQLHPNLFYLGPQLRTAETDDSLRNIDLALHNWAFLRGTLGLDQPGAEAK